MKLNELIVGIAINSKNGIAIAQICRTINDRGLSYCNKKLCYANKRKRDKEFVPNPVCKYSRTLISNRINKLEALETLKTRKERRTDSRQPRGWDWMRVVYSVGNFPEDKFDQVKL